MQSSIHAQESTSLESAFQCRNVHNRNLDEHVYCTLLRKACCPSSVYVDACSRPRQATVWALHGEVLFLVMHVVSCHPGDNSAGNGNSSIRPHRKAGLPVFERIVTISAKCKAKNLVICSFEMLAKSQRRQVEGVLLTSQRCSSCR